MTNDQVSVTKVFDAAIESVWDAWTNPASMKQWFSPEGMTNPEVTVDFTVGGKYRVVMEGKNMPDPTHYGTMAVGGEYIEIDKPHKLVFTWLWENSPADSHTTKIVLLFKKINETQTEMTLTHSGFVDDNMKTEHTMGWHSTFNKLALFLREGGRL